MKLFLFMIALSSCSVWSQASLAQSHDLAYRDQDIANRVAICVNNYNVLLNEKFQTAGAKYAGGVLNVVPATPSRESTDQCRNRASSIVSGLTTLHDTNVREVREGIAELRDQLVECISDQVKAVERAPR